MELIGTTFPSDNILITDEPTEVFSPIRWKAFRVRQNVE
jgi:hypothetical protein